MVRYGGSFTSTLALVLLSTVTLANDKEGWTPAEFADARLAKDKSICSGDIEQDGCCMLTRTKPEPVSKPSLLIKSERFHLV